ncbi:hypothetical protein [Weissella sagaensis]|jgi:hypothetical protein|uniref:Uncharacterized protein n=1 Tax=Weissella sagaensis TaxID=2559928 RepID=A0ABW1RRJ5_9LACO|nr:hypothetical protein [Weissella sagaensis]KAA8435116.1 hypothetical protein FKV79_00530 [Weissella paramesenteroides]MBU7568581.1 hypothetical protein [Weissella hellenica]KAA8439007.1 hypothetical protein FKV73_01640 [Weissella paramesenteroides]QDJ58427.1 hypothetical protein EFA59_02365 [Weissella hellenica]QEA57421.1 hypothetical protein FGL75_05885 [Weissella hellenica]
MAEAFQTLDIIEEITRNDGSTYKEIGNLLHNGQSEYAVEKGMIKKVRILKINIPHSANVMKYEKFVNENFDIPTNVAISEFIEWQRSPEMDALVDKILAENKVS